MLSKIIRISTASFTPGGFCFCTAQETAVNGAITPRWIVFAWMIERTMIFWAEITLFPCVFCVCCFYDKISFTVGGLCIWRQFSVSTGTLYSTFHFDPSLTNCSAWHSPDVCEVETEEWLQESKVILTYCYRHISKHIRVKTVPQAWYIMAPHNEKRNQLCQAS